MQIRDRKLWKGDYDSFPAYLEARWGISKQHGNRLIQAAHVVAGIEEVEPIGSTPLPATESQARALAAAPPEERAEVWQEAVTRNGGEPAPARVVAEVIAGRPSHWRSYRSWSWG